VGFCQNIGVVIMHNSGFTLTELAMSLVIVAFITAGVLQGDNLIKAAKGRAVSSEVQSHKVAVNSFYAKYTAYPGDFADAEDYWGVANTDDGDDDGKIEFISGSVYEGYRAWQHLSYARMINDDFFGN